MWIDVIDMATKYMQIYFIGMPIMMLYNFSASILRAVGDTMRPLIFLVVSGIVNVGLNIIFVLVFKKDVEGVAIATVASQAISAVLCITTLFKSNGYARLEIRYIRFYKRELVDMIKIGVPAGLQGCLFSISNVMVQSTINGYGKIIMAGNTVASQIEGFIYNACNSVSLTALAFVSQNYGAKKPDRIRKVVKEVLAVAGVLALAMSAVVVIFSKPLSLLFNDSVEAIAVAQTRLSLIGATYVLCAVMDVMGNVMRGLNKSTTAMVVSLLGSCLFRILWIHTIYLLSPSLTMLYMVFPISWILTSCIHFAIYFPTMKKVQKQLNDEIERENQGVKA